MKRTIAPAIVGLVVAVLGGCGHYIVTEPDSGKTYYTRHINRNLGNKVITFVDADTGAKVTLSESEVRKITKDEFDNAVPMNERAMDHPADSTRSAAR
jgi:hypothetical protein